MVYMFVQHYNIDQETCYSREVMFSDPCELGPLHFKTSIYFKTAHSVHDTTHIFFNIAIPSF